MSFLVKSASFDQIQLMLAWAKEEGWNPGLNDALAYQLIDPSGFFIGVLDGLPIAAISCVRYSNEFSFLGLYLVKPEFRGQGYGLQVWQRAIEYAKSTNIALDGVVAQQANYQKSGFNLLHKNSRYSFSNPFTQSSLSSSVLYATQVPMASILKYCAPFFPGERNAFWMYWLLMNKAISLVQCDGDKITGLGVIRECIKGYKIGPLFADNEAIAESLFQQLCQSCPLESVISIDIPVINPMALKLVESHHLKPVFETARMAIRPLPSLAVDRTLGVTSFEVG